MKARNPTHREWLKHKDRLTGPDGTAAVLARSIHPTQEGEEILGPSMKSKARSGHVHYAPIRVVELFYEFLAQGRPADIDRLVLWFQQQAVEVQRGESVDLDALMRMEQEADGRDDPLQLQLAQGDWGVSDDCAMALLDQSAKSRRLAIRIQQEDRERRIS